MEESLGKAEMAYKALREDVTQGRLSPGERLVEKNLMKRFGVSKTPIREALSRLKQDGVVEGSPHHSVSVIRVSPNDAVEIYDLREILEGLAAKKTAEKTTPDKANEMRSIIRHFEKCVKKNDVREYISLDVRFHKTLGAMSGSKRLSDMMEHLYHQSRILLKTSLKLPGRGPAVSLTEHKKIVEAIIDEDVSLAEQMAREHIDKTKKAVLNWFNRTQW